MPWKEINPMDQKTEFVHRALTEAISFFELCREYNNRRKKRTESLRAFRLYLW